ncbi:MAG: ATP-dependent dethiobiotin synthetase BioD [Desulfobulbaceae bacterium]|nr:ATP-dependent dethiobiotin synthetase BioD [Desulfobulbaceae bacterium]
MKNKTLCICGIDTGIGKSVVTGLLGRYLADQGQSVITQKLVQTGCGDRPVDILLHRQLMGMQWNEFDEQGLTCPCCFPFPASPHLAARLAGSTIEPDMLSQASEKLADRHEWLLIEGAGGLHVPLTEEITLLDYLAKRDCPIILVTSPRLGSINHTLLSLEAIKARNMNLVGLVYNLYGENPREIVLDSLRVFKHGLKRYGFADRVVLLPDRKESKSTNWQVLL